MKKIKPTDWVPYGGLQLEPVAIDVITQAGNFLVVAGPGAGKTELLAQKAAFLLQTNQCKYPRRILAISFKRDAAYNLKDRARLRCGKELSLRFDSWTFDTFAKLLLDHFRNQLYEDLKVSKDYQVLLNDKAILDYYESVDRDFRFQNQDTDLMSFHTLSAFPLQNNSQGDIARINAWRQMLGSVPSKLTFKMIMRLAEYIITNNEPVRSFLRQTYSHVFLDEFQDATSIQYEFFKSCFWGSDCQFTAVGDDKQRIMLWAGAKENVFEDYQKELQAILKTLKMNFRCAPRLVALLNYLTEHLLGKTDFAEADSRKPLDEGECFLWNYSSEKAEMASLLKQVKYWIEIDGLKANEICILVKGSLQTYVGNLIAYFQENGLAARDESLLQDLIGQELVQYFIHAFYVIYDERSGESKRICLSFLANTSTEMTDEHLLSLEKSFYKFTRKVRETYKPSKKSEIDLIVKELIEFAGRSRIKNAYPIYTNDTFLDLTIIQFIQELKLNVVPGQGIVKAINRFAGENTIPVMTVHKSKGLEYHTVIFVGLEDRAFWTYKDQASEDNCTFFVALSRAKQRVVFTFSRSRTDAYGNIRIQKVSAIKEIVDTLMQSGLVDVADM
ncbi:UvrD-helicase domain-containing protein [Dyadobacter bucti]|uniref:UvrD-helicase domain-containing protein n=1 Tax=Dyadobacter bucti TaxID=2572203 RepID=UPI001109B21C|nr:ATP-dependent helicase [Dyadobacter bucti]